MIGKKKAKWVGAALFSISCLLLVSLFTSQACMAKGKLKWYSSLQSGLAQAKASNKWVFVDIGADY